MQAEVGECVHEKVYKQFVAVEVTECFTVANIVTELFWMLSLNLLQISVGVKYPTVCLKQTCRSAS